MAKILVTQPSCVFAVIIFVLLLFSVGLLVFVLKGQLHHETTMEKAVVSHKGLSRGPSTNTPSPPMVSTTLPDSQSDAAGHAHQPDDTPWLDFRLSRTIIPLHYDLLLHPDLDVDTFSGTVEITTNVTKDTRHFVVHAYKLTVRDVRVVDVRLDKEVALAKQFVYSPHEYFVVTLEEQVKVGTYRLKFEFGGTLNGTIIGFYKSRYKNGRNEPRYLATSKFQPTYARRAFPCFDEPSFKATFSVALVHDQDHLALSNMPAQSTDQYASEQRLMVTKFQRSVPMVTYLVCFIVCDFQFQETTISSGKPFRVYTTPDQVNLTTYALDFGSKVLEYFESYFNIGYPLPKQDMVGIPDFASGAMEHWGVVTFRETNLLVDPGDSSPQHLQRISSVISHEMTHMWFGNLVTMSWWDDLWLNEGFASYVEYKGVDQQHPQWDTLSQFVTEELQPVMNLDSTLSSHPIVQPVLHPDEITEIFDDISYGKGASVLRMLEFFVGEGNFRAGISNFLKKHQFRNAKTGDLWKELEATCGLQGGHLISDIMRTWTEQMGFPYVTVSRVSRNGSTSFTARQSRFLKNQAMQVPQTESGYVWSVPLSYTTGEGGTGIVWVHDQNELEFSVAGLPSSWVKFNVNQTGFFLVNYQKEEWLRFSHLLLNDHQVLSPADRSNLLFDSFLLAEAGHVPLHLFLSMSQYLVHETHLIPWETAYASFVYLCQMLEDTQVNVMLKGYIRDLTSDLYKKLGWRTSENHLDNLLRTTIIGLACHSGNQECLNHASELFQNWTQGQEIPSSLRSLVYNFGMSEIGREEHWSHMWSRYLREESAAQKKTIMNGLAHVRKPHLILRYLDYAMDPEKVRSQDFFTILSYIAGNPVGRPLVWNFIRDQWPALVERFTLNNRYLGNAVKKICSYFTTERQLEEMRAFFARYPDAGAGRRRRQQALEAVQNNIRWIRSHSRGLKEWLEVEGPTPWYSPRLPSHAVPEHYDLHLHPSLAEGVFRGRVSISVALHEATDRLLVHAGHLLNVSEAQVWSVGSGSESKKIDVLEKVYSEENEYLVLKMGEKLPLGRYRLYFEFEGSLAPSLKGLYTSSYLDPNTKQRKLLAATHLSPTHARRVFPCFDEPFFRATFNVSVLHSPLYALSNSPVQETSITEEGLQLSRFVESLPMPTHLLAIVVCDFPYVETREDNGPRVRIYAADHLLKNAEYVLRSASKIIEYYEKYFGVSFPLKKLDLAVIPDLARSGAANWGLITLREDSVLCGADCPMAARYRVATLIAKLLAQQWFGDLVTMRWWDELWLNEGFSTYISRKGVAHVEPDLDKEDDIELLRLTDAMMFDRTIYSRSIVQRVEKVSGIHDGIECKKGSSILRMLENYIGDDFRDGISAYLTRHSLGDATTQDLWEALESTSRQGLNVSRMMDTWTRQMNYPYLSANCSGGGSCILLQHRFLEDPETAQLSAQPAPYDYTWQIPLTYRTSNSNEVVNLLINTTEKVSVDVPSGDWIKFNADFSGYYSVNYDRQTWARITQVLHDNHTAFSPADRVNLVYDSFSLANAGLVDFDVPLKLIGYLGREEFHGVWRVALAELNNLKMYFKADREIRELIKEYIRSLSKGHLKKYGWNDSGDYSERELRKVILLASCESRSGECLDTAAHLLKQWTQGVRLSADTKQVVFWYGLKSYSAEQTWTLMWSKFGAEKDPREKLVLLDALATIRNTTLLERLVGLSSDESLVRRHHRLRLLGRIARNPKGFPLVAHLIYTQWEQLNRLYGREETEEFAAEVFKGYSTKKDLQKVREFYLRQKGVAGQGVRSHTLYSIAWNIHWLKRHRTPVRDWLLANVYMPWRNIRLPRHILPTNYDLLLRPDIPEGTFDGEVRIRISVAMETDYLLIHESGLAIVGSELRGEAEQEDIPIAEEFSYKRNEYRVILLEEKIAAGVYFLKLEFSGKFSGSGTGMDRYEYQHRKSGLTSQLAATRFEATYARKVFPCFDEPAFKAKFKLSVLHPANLTALSNMPEEERVNITEDLVKTVFVESATMSTYLLSCVVSDFGHVQADYKGKPVRVFAPPDRLDEAAHGLNLTLRLLATLEEFFDVPYVLPKLDSVCIPGYSVPGMEHWGVISYDANRFLVNGSLSERRRILYADRVIAHEVVHQWFGNLVTMEWWDDLWLNEGMSTLIMYIPLKQYFPSISQVDVRKMSRMMCPDSSLDSHPIVRNVSTPDEIDSAFNVISYKKGAAVMKMLQYIMKDDFRKGLSNYLKRYAYKNAETKDLWAELDAATTLKVNVSGLMDTWTRQMGFPYVELARDGANLTATQRWFSRNVNQSWAEGVALTQKYGFIWQIPLTFKNLGSGNEYTLWLTEKTATFQISAMREDVLKFNPGFIGFYVVKYDAGDWNRLANKLLGDHEAFDVADRYNLLHDAFVLAETDRLSYSTPLSLTRYLHKERDTLPWNLFRDHLLYFQHSLDAQSPALALLKKYVANLTSDLYDEVVASADGEDRAAWRVHRKWDSKADSCPVGYSDMGLESVLLDLACRSDNRKCLDAMHQELQLWLLGQNVTSDLHLVLEVGISHFGNDTLWTFLAEEMAANETDRDRKFLLAEALASFSSPTLVAKTIDVMAFDARIDLELAKFIFLRLINKPDAMPQLWNYAIKHWDSLMNRLEAQSDPSVGISVFCDKLKSVRHLGDFIRLVKRRSPASDFVTRSCLEEIQGSVEWAAKYEEQLSEWLREHV